MNVRIGIAETGKELEVDLGEDAKVADVKKDLEKQLSGGGVLWLEDKKGALVGALVEKIAFVQIGAENAEHRIGFVG